MRYIFLLLLTFLTLQPAWAWRQVNENAAEPLREFRAAWVASVFNLDWPSRAGLSARQQQSELLQILNTASKLKLNAIILQVRPNGDALYASRYEPWSAWLSGADVNPGYDPLAFAIREAHRRGIEIHAWINPFRSTIQGKSIGRKHIARRKPQLHKRAGTTTILNPGNSEAQAHVLDVALDIVKRYDIDGLHIDDYFYPYPPHHNINDGKSPAQRRAAINRFVSQLYRKVKSQKPWVRVGISPFGIWHTGYPAGVEAGVSAYEHLACDACTWLRKGWVDYLAPQLYWRIAGPQSFTSLMRWWSAINPARPIWPGIASVRINSKTDPGRPASEIGRQIDYSRSLAKSSAGQLFWSWSSLAENRGGVQREMAARYRSLALPPSMPWSGNTRPNRPSIAAQLQKTGLLIRWSPQDKSARKWIIQGRRAGRWTTLCVLPHNTRHITLPASYTRNYDRFALRGISGSGVSGVPAVLAR